MSWPIVMDLDGDGVELAALDESAAFYDINGDGYQYNLGWAHADDGLLAYDKDNDGDITDKDEISFVGYKAGARTDWEGLVHFDSNNDGILDSRDAGFAKFRVWQDADGDGDVDAGELRTLAQRGIRSLDLNPNYGAELSPTDRDGNLIYGEGGYTKTDGTRGVFGDVALATSATGYRVHNGELEFKTADGVGKVYVAPTNSVAVNLRFADAGRRAPSLPTIPHATVMEIISVGFDDGDMNAVFYGLSLLESEQVREPNTNYLGTLSTGHIGAVGSSHADTMDGSDASRDLLLFGDEGDDNLTGGSGDDWLAGGDGADHLQSGAGDDTLFFDADDMARGTVSGGAGFDVGIFTDDTALNLDLRRHGLETVHAGAGDDVLTAGTTTEGVAVHGGAGNDWLTGGVGDDVVSGDGGNDRLFGGSGKDVLSGGDGDDYIKGHRGDDVLLGGAGDDYLTGNFGDDVLFGGDGDDYLNGLVGDDTLYGGVGSDTYDFGYPNVPMGVLPDFGRETVRDSGGANDRVTFGRRRHEDLWLTRDGDDLRISVLGGADDEVLIEDQFAAGGAHRIEHLSAATRLLSYGRYNEQSVSIDALVNAMVQFDKPQAGWSRMTAQERADVHAAWRSVGIAPTVG